MERFLLTERAMIPSLPVVPRIVCVNSCSLFPSLSDHTNTTRNRVEYHFGAFLKVSRLHGREPQRLPKPVVLVQK